MAKGMARKPKPAIPRREVAVDRDSWLGRVRLLALKNMLGLGLTAEEEAFLGPMPRVAVFTPAEVIDLLGDGAKGIPRMLPVDVALGRLGMPIVRARPDGTAERLHKEFPKAWAARERADRAIALHVAKTYVEVPQGWYPDRERLMMGDVVDDAARAAGVPDIGPGARVLLEDHVPFVRFDLVPADLRLAGYQMWHRRRLAGISPLAGDGLVFGFWDEVLGGIDVPARSLRGWTYAYLAMWAMIIRDLAVATLCDADPDAPGKVAARSGPHAKMYQSFMGELIYHSSLEGGAPSFGAGLARLHKEEVARPGSVWSSHPVRERPEAWLDVSWFKYTRLPGPVPEDLREDFGDYEPGGPSEPYTSWIERFVSA